MKKTVKIILIILASIFCLVFLAIAGTAFVFRNEISVYSSIRQLKPANREEYQGGVYEITYKGNYYFDDYLKMGGVKTDKELTDFLNKKFTKGLVAMETSTGNFGCSAFTARTKNGQKLLARNYDYPATNTCIVKVKGNRKRHASVSTVDLSFLGIPFNKDMDSFSTKIFSISAVYIPLDGINDAGVSCGVLESGQGPGMRSVPTNQNTDKPDISTGPFIRLILDYADSLEEAVELAKNYDMHDSGTASYHYIIADKTGRSAILEWVNDVDLNDFYGQKRELVVTYNDSDSAIGPREAASDFQWITNFIIQPGYHEGTEEKYISGLDRYNIIYEKLSPVNGIVQDEKQAMDILCSASQKSVAPERRKIYNHLTVHSAVYNLDELSVLWCPAEQYQDVQGMIKYHIKNGKIVND